MGGLRWIDRLLKLAGRRPRRRTGQPETGQPETGQPETDHDRIRRYQRVLETLDVPKSERDKLWPRPTLRVIEGDARTPDARAPDARTPEARTPED